MKPRARKQRSFFDLWDRVLIGDGCWEIQGSRTRAGYGTVPWLGTSSGMELAHRLAYMTWHGMLIIPKGLQVNHHCDNRACCRPDHLYLGTQVENMRDAVSRGRTSNSNRGKAECKHGHPFDEANTYIYWVDGKPHRACRICKQERCRAKRRAA